MTDKPDRKSVLLVEDEAHLVEYMTESLEDEGYRVVWAKDLSGAISKVRNEKFDCIICDHRLERGTGEEFILSVRKSVGHINQHTPAILVSAYISRDIIQSIGWLIQGALVKPYKTGALVSKLEEAMNAAF